MNKIIIYKEVRVPIGNHEGKRIIIGADHRGFNCKNKVIKNLEERGYTILDIGTFSPERCDYPYISDEIGKKVSEDRDYNTVGIGICGSGIGILIPASKYKGIYAARCLTPKEAETSRKHNNTNVLGLGADCTDLETAIRTVFSWLETQFYTDPEKEENYLERYVQTVKLENQE